MPDQMTVGHSAFTPDPRPASVLLEAEVLINGDRARDYGPVEVNWGRTVEIFKGLTGIELSIEQALLFMVAVKLARQRHRQKRDNVRDTCGYLALYERVVGGGEPGEEREVPE